MLQEPGHFAKCIGFWFVRQLVCFPCCKCEESRLDSARTTKPLEDAGQPQDHFPLDSRLRVIVGNHGRLEGFVIVRVFQATNDRFGRQSVTQGIAARSALAFRRSGPGAFRCIAPVCFNLPLGGHRGSAGNDWVRFVTRSQMCLQSYELRARVHCPPIPDGSAPRVLWQWEADRS